MPNTSPNASQWNMVFVGHARVRFVLGMYISYCLCQFHLCWVASANGFFFVEYGITHYVLPVVQLMINGTH